MLQLHDYYQQGHLPASGGVADQPHKAMQAISIIAARRAHNAEKKRGKKGQR